MGASLKCLRFDALGLKMLEVEGEVVGGEEEPGGGRFQQDGLTLHSTLTLTMAVQMISLIPVQMEMRGNLTSLILRGTLLLS